MVISKPPFVLPKMKFIVSMAATYYYQAGIDMTYLTILSKSGIFANISLSAESSQTILNVTFTPPIVVSWSLFYCIYDKVTSQLSMENHWDLINSIFLLMLKTKNSIQLQGSYIYIYIYIYIVPVSVHAL